MNIQKETQAMLVSDMIDKIILERFLIKSIPKIRIIPYEQLEKLTHLKIKGLQRSLKSKLFISHKNDIEITENEQLLAGKANELIRGLIKKYVIPSQYTGGEELRDIAGVLDEQSYTDTEKNFIDFIFNTFISLTEINFSPKKVMTFETIQVLLNFNLVNNSQFRHFSKDIYNAVLQAKLHAGDTLKPYIEKSYKNNNENEIETRLKLSAEYDYYFDDKANLRCDLDTNKSVFIKNLLNTIISELNDLTVKLLLLVNLQNKYPFLIRDKIFSEFS